MEMRRPSLNAGIALGLGLAGLILYVRTAAPSVVAIFDDSLEFQVVLPTLGIAHPTGYPLYTLLGYLFTRLPLGEMAYRANLFSAVTGAAAASLLYLAGRELSGRRLAAALAAIQFTVVPAWWSQATVTEVYALHGLLQALLLWLMLRWAHGRGRLWPVGLALGLGLTHHRMILLLTPALALWLAGRRDDLRRARASWLPTVSALAAPLLLYAYLPLRGRAITSLDDTYRNDWAGFWGWVTARGYNVFLTGNPFSIERDARFYVDLVRDQVGAWGVALAILGLAALAAGWTGRDRRQARWDGLCLAVALATTYGFGVAYRAADIEAFFLPAFLCTALAVAAGLAALQMGWKRCLQIQVIPRSVLRLRSLACRPGQAGQAFCDEESPPSQAEIPRLADSARNDITGGIFRTVPHAGGGATAHENVMLSGVCGAKHLYLRWTRFLARRLARNDVVGGIFRTGRMAVIGYVILGTAFLAVVLGPAMARFPQMDRSRRWAVHELGEDMLRQPLPEGSAIVSILGETTLVRYFQFAHGLRPDVQPIPADREAYRLMAVDRLLSEGRPAFLTRPTLGAEERYSLGAVGPLIRAWPKGASAWDRLPGQTDQAMGQGVHLIGYLVEAKTLRSGRMVRLTLHWLAENRIEERLKVSARLATPADDKVATADDEPVHAAYPTTAWLPGEIVQDVYDLRVPPSVAEGTYEVLVILYRAADGSEIGRARLGVIALSPP